MNALSRTPRTLAEMLNEMTDQRNTLALILRDLLAAKNAEEAALAHQRAHAALARVPYTVLLARKPE